jgi:hypothetical protein
VRADLRQRGQVLILLAAWLFFSGGASTALVVYEHPASEIKKTIKRVIPDDTRREALLTNIDTWEWVQEKQDEQVRDAREKLLEILRRKGSQSYEVETIVAKLDERFAEMDRKFLDLRFRLKEQVTRAEWSQLVAQPSP